MKVYLESLGCVRNQVNSEVMLGQLSGNRISVTNEPHEAEAIVVNTCSFIESAANESIDTILELAKFKEEGVCTKLIVVGCLPERYRKDIATALPEVDMFLGTGSYDRIAQAILGEKPADACILENPNLIDITRKQSVRKRTDKHLAYVKTAEGCMRHCTYCIIPKLRGKLRSRPEEVILSEVSDLVDDGAREILFVAECSTDYGRENHREGAREKASERFTKLLAETGDIVKDGWVRVLYGHPESLTDEMIKAMETHENLCSYFDLPIQHASSSVLKKMGREYTREQLIKMYGRIRELSPSASLRTTIIVGFPGETEEDFKELLSFVEEIRFDHLGVFTYSDSDDLPSNKLDGHVPEEVARERQDTLMGKQADISAEINKKHVGKKYRVIIEENPEEGVYLGRCSFQAPEVDGVTFVYTEKNLTIGEFADVTITDAYEYDIAGEINE